MANIIQGGGSPRWRGDGKELFFVQNSDGKLMAVSAGASKGGFVAGKPVELFQIPRFLRTNFEVTRDGQRFLIVEPAKGPAVQPLTVLLNWQEMLKK